MTWFKALWVMQMCLARAVVPLGELWPADEGRPEDPLQWVLVQGSAEAAA